MMDRKPEEVLRLAVERMLPKTRLGRKMIKKLKIYIQQGKLMVLQVMKKRQAKVLWLELMQLLEY